MSIKQQSVGFLKNAIPCLASFRFFLKILNGHLSIEQLELSDLIIDHELDSILFNFFTENKTIISLKLHRCEFHGTFLTFLNYFNEKNTIKELSFDNSTFNKANHNNESLPIFTNLIHLSFARCRLNNDEIIMLTKIVHKNKSIQSLDISCNEISISIFPQIISMLEDSKLRKINLSRTKLQDFDFIKICEALKNNIIMESINLNFNECSSEEKLFELLEVNKNLKNFEIFKNNFNKEIENKIAKILKER